MYAQRTSFFPKPEAAAELRPVLEERARAAQAHGWRATLVVAVFAARPAFHLGLVVDDLAAIDRYRDEQREAIAAAGARIAALLREPIVAALSELIIPARAGTDTPRYSHRLTARPLPGRLGDLQAVLMERVRVQEAGGMRVALSVGVSGPDTGAVNTNYTFETLAGLGDMRARNETDAGFRELRLKLADLLASPTEAETLEILVPLPPRE